MSTIIMHVDSNEPDRLFASTVRAMRLSLGVSSAQLSMASGIPSRSMATIEDGGTATRAERHDITVALSWLSTNRVARPLRH